MMSSTKKKFLDTPICHSQLCTRAKNHLIRYIQKELYISKKPFKDGRIITLGDALNRIYNLNDVLNVGDKTINQIIEFYEQNGINVNKWKGK